MEISGISGSMISSSQASVGTSRGSLRNREAAADPAPPRGDYDDQYRVRRGRTLDVFRKELQYALMTRFRARVTTTHNAYGGVQAPADSDVVAGEVLAGAKQVAREQPTQVAKSMVSFRASVRESAEYARTTVGEAADLEKAVATVERGIDEIENESSKSRESSATVLTADMRSKQRSTIRIRTQEGDVVRFDLKRIDRLSASDQAVRDDEGFMSVTEVEASSRTRLMMRVKGDINESEYAAIQNVFAQAEVMANDFFDGDIAAAFSMAQGLEFDTEQLARVNMRFRSHQVSNIAYRETVVRPAPQVEETAAPVVSPAKPAEIATPPKSADAPARSVADRASGDLVEATKKPEVISADPDDNALGRYFDALGEFLRSVGEGFEAGSFRYHYSESFKLKLLESVVHSMAPDNSSPGEAVTEPLAVDVTESAED